MHFLMSVYVMPSLFDSSSVLEAFEWHDPIRSLVEKYHNNNMVVDRYNEYATYFQFLIIVWGRLIQDFKSYEVFKDIVNEQIYSEMPGMHILSSNERNILSRFDAVKLVLQVDYESFLIFANILMDKIAKMTKSLLIQDREIPTHSFHEHKDYFLKSSNIPYCLKEEYAKLIREQTEWYDVSLGLARDKLVTHGGTNGIGIHGRISANGIRIEKVKVSGDFTKEAENIIAIKKGYEDKYPELKKVDDNLWEIMDFIMNNNIILNKKDKQTFIPIVHKTGGPLPTLCYTARSIGNFLQAFVSIFLNYFPIYDDT